MLSDLRKSLNRRHLTDPAYAFLFDEDTSGESVALAVGASSFDAERADLLEVVAIPIRGNRLLTSRRLHLKVGTSAPNPAPSVQERADQEQAALELLRFVGARPLVGYYLTFAVALIDRLVKPRIGVQTPNPVVEVSGLYYDHHRPSAGRPTADLRFDAILRDLDLPERGTPGPLADAVSSGLIYLTLRPPAA
ncbi:3'-5' exonuclease [Skermanella mucosa]|uniref:3'-5' exonuclease n=1 Tax=Skermanella mucosa TaxID=1789672 RepID=UPI00192B2D41|nr:3'-5' exonuclease [Skermanella mucosa]UEM20030.1 3'-5' exonuclease [Skermanella mucosa]